MSQHQHPEPDARTATPPGARPAVSVGEGLLLTAWLVVGQLVFGGIAVALGITDFTGDTTGRLVLVTIQAAVLAAALAWLGGRGRLTTVVAPGRRARGGDLLLGLGVGVGGFVVLVLALGGLFQWLGDVDPPEQQALQDAAVGGVDALLAITLAVLIAPVLEELIFRGALHGALRARIGFWPAALLSSGVFALIHIEIVTSSPVFLVQLFLLGVVFAWLYERTGNLAAPVVAHLAFNAVSMGIALLAPELDELAALVRGPWS